MSKENNSNKHKNKEKKSYENRTMKLNTPKKGDRKPPGQKKH